MNNTTYQRIGDTMAIVGIELTPAVIEWQEILDRITIEPDDWPDAPWQNCDGYEHFLENAEPVLNRAEET